MTDSTSYFVAWPEETSQGSRASSLIPTLGAATTAVDQYRIGGIHSTNLPDLGASFTDIRSVSALARIAEGGIGSYRDLEEAEMALQALLLNDIAHVVVHAPKIDFGTGIVSYLRGDNDARSPYCFDLMQIANSRDFLIAPEFLTAHEGIISAATFSDCPLLGKAVSELGPGYQYWNTTIADAINASIAQHGIPAYLSDPLLLRSRPGDGFQKGFYHRLQISWKKLTEGLPPIVCTFGLPPLLAIVLDRLNNRQDLKSALLDLRNELAPVRVELREFNQILTSSVDQFEVTRRVRGITDTFDAVFAEASLSGAERIQRNLAIIQRITRPVIKFMAGFVTKTGPSFDDLMSLAPASVIVEERSMVDRSVTARSFSKLIKVEPIQSLVKHHFTAAEIKAIEASLAANY